MLQVLWNISVAMLVAFAVVFVDVVAVVKGLATTVFTLPAAFSAFNL